MAHQAKVLTALGTGLSFMALAAFSGVPASATDRTTSVTQSKPIVLAQAKKKKKKKKSTRSTTSSRKKSTTPRRPRQSRGSFSGG